MDLPSAPSAAYFAHPHAAAATASPPPSSPSSPFPSRPPSPSSRVSYAYPSTPDIASTRESSTAPPSTRSASHSKNPLLKRPRRHGRRAEGQGWLAWLLGGVKGHGKASPQELELGETRGRRFSAGQAEAATPSAASARAAARAATTGSGAKKGWMTRERAQLAVAFAMIALVGMNDSATGANLDKMQEHYGVSYDKISTVFLSNTAGYFLSSISASFFLHHFGLQVSLLVASAAMSTGCVVLSVAPPFPVFVSMLLFMGFGSGMYDASITTIISHEEDGVLMSWLYSCFGVGAMISPLMIGAFVDKGYDWNRYYNMPLGFSLILAVIGFFTFRGYEVPPDEAHDATLATAQAPEGSAAPASGEVIHARAVMSAQQRMKRALKLPSVYVGFLLIICAFASTDILSAWIVSFMIQKRSSPAAATRFVLAGVWAGIALGRVVLAWLLTKRLGERAFSIVLLVAACAMFAVLYVHNFAVNAVVTVLAGFFIGPVTPKVLDVVGVRVPPSLKSAVMSLTIGLGLIGSSVGPLLFGLVAGRGGLSTLPAVLIGISVVSIIGWFCVPRNRRRED
ncbi:MFS transporter [Rhodotorula paludigena]|uniref:MFS transporter n=1 Tax=Rhodotorula paludigena TaxID=86838 RepID=UPI00317ED5FB